MAKVGRPKKRKVAVKKKVTKRKVTKKKPLSRGKKLTATELKQAARQLGAKGGKASALKKKKSASSKKGKKRVVTMRNGVMTVKYK